jgi:hypothetical protein
VSQSKKSAVIEESVQNQQVKSLSACSTIAIKEMNKQVPKSKNKQTKKPP